MEIKVKTLLFIAAVMLNGCVSAGFHQRKVQEARGQQCQHEYAEAHYQNMPVSLCHKCGVVRVKQ